MWKSSRDISKLVSSFSGLDKLRSLYSLSRFWESAIYPENYHANDKLPSLLVPTEAGRKYIEDLKDIITHYPKPDFYLALFAFFSYHEIIFDWELSDHGAIRLLLEEELLKGQIQLPYRFGRLLYDRFNDHFYNDGINHIPPPDVAKLLRGTPVGIYQLGKYLSGPLGILESQEARYLPPELRLPLWHCSDTGCRSLHRVTLLPPRIPCVIAYDNISNLLFDKYGPASEWLMPLRRMLRGDYGGRKYVDLPILIADSIIGSERIRLVSFALSGKRGQVLRETLSMAPRKKSYGIGSAKDVAMKLTPEGQVQILLVLPDQDLVTLVDQMVQNGDIRMSIGEVRKARQSPPHHSKDMRTELSSNGLRSESRNPVLILVSSILNAYDKGNMTSELNWRLRTAPEVSPRDGLAEFIRRVGPQRAIQDLILSSQIITEHICQEILLPMEGVMSVGQNIATNRILWKMGFDPPQYDEFFPRLESRLSLFNEIILSSTPIVSEDERERIRAAGVNLFVSAEEFIDLLISYNIWLLASDHFLGTKFIFDIYQARKLVKVVLGSTLNTDGVTFSWQESGDNSLGVLFRYLIESLDWINSLDKKNPDDYLRAKDDLPHFADLRYQQFPFRHTQLWADADISQLNKHIQIYNSIIKYLNQANLAFVRNSIDHKRGALDFPDSDALLACVTRVREALELADVGRFLPKVYWLQRINNDRFGLFEYELIDYKNRPLILHGPMMISGVPEISYREPWLIAPGNLLGGTYANIYFKQQERSEYREYWKDYPRRRHIPRTQAEIAVESEADLTKEP